MLMHPKLTMNVHSVGKHLYALDIEVKKIGCSRNADRDIESTKKHLAEVRQHGYQVHDAGGVCFRSRYLITNEDEIEVQGPQTSGEVEFAAIRIKDCILVSVGSDHNDRTITHMWSLVLGKVFDTAKAKQLAPAIIAPVAWEYDDIRDHWDKIVLRSSVMVSGEKMPYQEYPLANLLDLEYYVERYRWFNTEGSVLFGGSSGLLSSIPDHIYKGQEHLDGIDIPQNFHVEMYDPILERTIDHSYEVSALEDHGSLSL